MCLLSNVFSYVYVCVCVCVFVCVCVYVHTHTHTHLHTFTHTCTHTPQRRASPVQLLIVNPGAVRVHQHAAGGVSRHLSRGELGLCHRAAGADVSAPGCVGEAVSQHEAAPNCRCGSTTNWSNRTNWIGKTCTNHNREMPFLFSIKTVEGQKPFHPNIIPSHSRRSVLLPP